MFSALPLTFAFFLHFLHPTLAASAANAANAHVADILAVNEILEIQINHTIADVNAVVALNKTVIAPIRKKTTAFHAKSITVVAADITAIANPLEVAYNATLATPPLNTKQAVTVFNSFVTLNNVFQPLTRTLLLNAAPALTALGQETPIHTALFAVYNDYANDYEHAIDFLLASDAALDQPVINSEQPVVDELFSLLVAYWGFGKE